MRWSCLWAPTIRRRGKGPIEATAIGNVMMQAIAAGDVADVAQAREVIRNSFDLVHYEPQHTDRWDEAAEKFAPPAA